ncbi:phytanoyl-CoA dioxygenase [bacterium]|nr:phytanoyl-CoA dioxygenase [bacterium]
MTETGPSSLREKFIRDGYAILRRAISGSQIADLCSAIEGEPTGEAVRRKKSVYGVRNLLEMSPTVCSLAVSPGLWPLVTAILGPDAFASRAIFFDKTPDANWALGWHQDSVISVAEKIETPGFLAWGRKADVWQVQPPPEILSRMLALRVHLDDCSSVNGALRVIPGSHRHGWLDDELDDWKKRVPQAICAASAGDVVAMCPMTLHASSRAVQPTHRRVIHIEYAAESLPNGLQWNRQIRP